MGDEGKKRSQTFASWAQYDRPEAVQARERQLRRARYDRLKAAGICTRCRFRPARPGFTACEGCAAKVRAYVKEWKREEESFIRVLTRREE